MACSCSHWWHAPVYFSISMVLAIIAITSTSPPSPPPSATTTTTTTTTSMISSSSSIPLNASMALRAQNFTIIATLLHVSPELFLSYSPGNPKLTVFAIQDSAISNLFVPSWATKLLFQYHTLHEKITFQELLLKPQNCCVPTSIPSKNLAISKIDSKNRVIEINNVPISHPNLFLDESISIHGVLAPFTSLDPHEIRSGLDFIHTPNCNYIFDSTRTHVSEWIQLIRILSSNGFVSFAISLNSILDRILWENPNLGPVTIFIPPEFEFVGSPYPFLNRIVRYHILRFRYSYSELGLLPEKSYLSTLLPEKVLEITRSVNGSQVLSINGVDVDSPDIFSTELFVVHGISRAFDLLEHPNT